MSVPGDLDAPLTVLLHSGAHWILRGVLNRLRDQGFDRITEPHLTLLGHLDCGATHAAAVAERMGVTRQAIARTLRELEALGYVGLERDPVRKNQKVIVMTAAGESLALAARAALEETEAVLKERIGPTRLQGLREALRAEWGDA
jgi:DNA-binding MarR family transcriptional regulator